MVGRSSGVSCDVAVGALASCFGARALATGGAALAMGGAALATGASRITTQGRQRSALGVANLTDILPAEQAEAEAAAALNAQEAAVRESWIAVFKALAGGERPPEKTSPSPSTP
jgi:hypothetical protein